MSEMIEEVAKAMWDVRRAHANGAGVFLEFWGDGTIPKANGIMQEARAAIEAMREPTDAMVNAANALDEVSKGVLITPIPERAWEAMIDAALSTTATSPST